jgi:hypothetical protein
MNAPEQHAALLGRIAGFDWTQVHSNLDANGAAVLPKLLDARTCAALRESYAESGSFRSRIVMQRHNFGRGEYQYFARPLPPVVQTLRAAFYPHLVGIANAWAETLGEERRLPPSHAEFLAQCHAAGQTRPTPLLLRYGAGDYNCLHQDLYGELAFPLQLVVLLNEPGKDFDGGELVLVEQRPRMQSRAQVIPLEQGDAVIFAVHHRPVAGKRGAYRVNLRHGVSELRRGERYTLGVIFHDAR